MIILAIYQTLRVNIKELPMKRRNSIQIERYEDEFGGIESHFYVNFFIQTYRVKRSNVMHQ